MIAELGATWDQVARAIISTVGIYLTLVVLVRIIGQRSTQRAGNKKEIEARCGQIRTAPALSGQTMT